MDIWAEGTVSAKAWNTRGLGLGLSKKQLLWLEQSEQEE